MSNQPNPSGPKPSGGDYLKNLFAQTEAAPIPDLLVSAGTKTPAITGDSIIDLLSQMNLGFLAQYVVQGDTNRMFSEDVHADYLFFDYECPDTHSIEMSEPLPGDYVDEDEANDDEPPFLGECFGIDMGVPGKISTGLNIIFNEDTARYQLDWMYLQMDEEDPMDIDCNSSNAGEISAFLKGFSVIAAKIVNSQKTSRADLSVMKKFYNRPEDEQAQPSPRP